MEQSAAMECSDLESVGTYDPNIEWDANMYPNETEHSSIIDDAETLQRQSFTPSNFAPEVANLAGIQNDLDEKLRLNRIRLQQLEEIDRNETARLVTLQRKIEYIRRDLERMPEEEKLETDRYNAALSKLRELRTKEGLLNEQIEYIIQVYDDNTDILRGIETSFTEQKRLNCQRYAAFDAILADLSSISENVYVAVGDKSERIKLANERGQQYLAKLLNRQKEIEGLSKKIEAGRLSGNRLKQTLADTEKSVDAVAAQLEQLEMRISEEKQTYLTHECELNKAEEEVDGHLKMLEKDSEKIRAEFQKMVALTNSRRQVLKEKNMKLEAMIEEKNRLEKQKNSKLSQRYLVDIRFSNLLEARLKEEMLGATNKLDHLNSRLLGAEAEALQVSRELEAMQNDYQSMAHRLEVSSVELEILQENVNKAGSEFHTKERNLMLEYEEVRAKKETFQSEGRLLCQKANEIRAKKDELEALKGTRLALLSEKKASIDEAEKKKALILEGEAEIGRLGDEKKNLLDHVSRAQELRKTLENAKLEFKNFEDTARISKESYHKELEEIAKETERAEFQYNEDALLKKKAEIDNISQKKISTEEKLASVKKLAKKADDRNQHLSLEARLFGAASGGLFQTIAPPGDVVSSTVQSVSYNAQPPLTSAANVSSTVDNFDASPHSSSSEAAEFEKNRLQIRRSVPAARRRL
ncbi:Hypothetical protein NTJ_07266 [Nesidiocoris tenuis]|uniref:Uncharacterized protein n=1 Tax=Nesidiocoris tenuis TaxID=355587 RepID=A0ABN7ASY9_9HEMI|nr:Hypothetical protein NTJ_07266 [Nesidiocoris tenuis]